jgi:uncharacterized Tic20 family protein
MPTVTPEPASHYPQRYYRPLATRSTSPAMWAHLGALLTWLGGLIVFAPLSLFCFVTPLIIRAHCHENRFVRHHTTQALNSALTGLVLGLAAILIAVVAFFGGTGILGAGLALLVAIAAGILRLVYEIIGAVKASGGHRFTLPLWVAFRFIRDDTR